jgi:hypothetical protein
MGTTVFGGDGRPDVSRGRRAVPEDGLVVAVLVGRLVLGVAVSGFAG